MLKSCYDILTTGEKNRGHAIVHVEESGTGTSFPAVQRLRGFEQGEGH